MLNKRLKKGLVALAPLLVLALSVVWLVDFEATELGAAALRQASASTGIQLHASRYRINLVRGLELENVDASARIPGGLYTISMPAMRFDHRVWSLLSGQLEIERVVLTEPRVVVVIGLEPELSATVSPSGQSDKSRRPRERSETPQTEPSTSPVELRIREIELSDAAFSFDDELSLDGVDLSLQSPTLVRGALTLLHGITATGQLSIQKLSFRTTTVQNITATLALSGGRLELADGAFETDRGSFQANVHLDFNAIPARHRLSLTGRLKGVPGEMSFEGEGFGLDAANLKGDGRWTVPAGRFDAAPLWQILELTGSAYEATEFAFQIAEGRLTLDGLWIHGSIGLDGTLALVVSGTEVSGTWDSPVVR
ncbi:MAG: hypothetical protein BMS9Abin37_2746 [Acidobacteriota bacterium]|nr:MAG: hypothetical protein BMS9Abin37_2746 [Acidobacteriota bacterium]